MTRTRHQKSTRYYVYSALMHLGFVALLGISLQWTPTPVAPQRDEEEIVAAVAIDESLVQKELKKLKAIEDRKRRNEQDRQKKLDRRAREAQEKRKKEEQQLEKLKAEQEKARKEAEVKKKKEAEDLKKLRERQDAEEQRLMELARAREAEEEARRLEEQIRKEEAALKKKQDAARQKRVLSEAEKYISRIKAKVQGSWIQPGTFQSGSQCTVAVKLIPAGEIVDMKVSNCRGGSIFQRSVELAVRKASPLPVPSDPEVFAALRDIEFIFKPEISP